MKLQRSPDWHNSVPFGVQGEARISAPDRFFKIVLVGNSSVGKTSLLHRFCNNCFSPGTSATVGMWTGTLYLTGSLAALLAGFNMEICHPTSQLHWLPRRPVIMRRPTIPWPGYKRETRHPMARLQWGDLPPCGLVIMGRPATP